MEHLDLSQWYTAQQATERLIANSGRPVDPNYIRSLARYGKVEKVKIGTANLYKKADVDVYIVEPAGVKSGRAKRQKAVGKSKKRTKTAA